MFAIAMYRCCVVVIFERHYGNFYKLACYVVLDDRFRMNQDS